MNLVNNNNLHCFAHENTPSPISNTPKSPRLTTLFKTAVLGALAMSSPAAEARSVVRYDGGVLIPSLPHSDALAPPRQEYGPFYPTGLQCKIQENSLENCGSNEFSPLASYTKATGVTPAPLKPYLAKVVGMAPTYADSLKRFPENLSAFYSNGLGAVGNAEKACQLKPLQTYLKCEAEAEKMTGMIKSRGMEEEIYGNSPHEDGGIILRNPFAWGDPVYVVVGKDPQEHVHYRAALDYAEKSWLQDPCFYSKSDREIVNEIIHLNSVVTGRSASEGKSSFRSLEVLVSRSLGNSIEDYMKKLDKMGASQSEQQTFINSLQKLAEIQPSNIQSVLSKQEKKVWDKLVYFPPESKKVKRLMSELIIQLKEYAQSDMHPVALAAWVHCEMGKIHPFSDGNGRTARIIMNALLMRGGYSPVVFPDDDEYSAKINADQATPGVFAEYLASLIETQRSEKQVLFYPGAQRAEPVVDPVVDNEIGVVSGLFQRLFG